MITENEVLDAFDQVAEQMQPTSEVVAHKALQGHMVASGYDVKEVIDAINETLKTGILQDTGTPNRGLKKALETRILPDLCAGYKHNMGVQAEVDSIDTICTYAKVLLY